MRNFSKACGVAAAVAFMAGAPSAIADEIAKNACQLIGHGAPEKLGDRDDHAIDVVTASCRVESGLLEGGVVTGQYIWEWDKTTGTIVFGGGLVRKTGAAVVYQYTEGKTVLTMTDGKVTGYTSSGKGTWPVATGSASLLAGKSFTWSSKITGAGQYETVWSAD